MVAAHRTWSRSEIRVSRREKETIENGSGADFLPGSSGEVDYYSVADVDSWYLRGKENNVRQFQYREKIGSKFKSISRRFLDLIDKSIVLNVIM